MQLIRGLNNLPQFSQGSVVTIGAFDGVHLGHQALFKQVLAKSKALGLPSVVICFEPLPREYFALNEAPSRLMNFREKFDAIATLGIDVLLRIPFNERLRSMSAMAFIEKVFVNGLNAKHITIGDDFRFGNNREGGFALLKEVAPNFGFEVVDTSSVCEQGLRVSSSVIRKSLEQADFGEAATMLGKPYSMSGRVVYGRQLGRTLGFPTANINVKRHRCAMQGVYVVTIRLPNGEQYPAVANCGTRPTVDDGIKAVLEVHILDFDANLYGQRVDVMFLNKLRSEQKFNSLNDLKKAIQDDANNARTWFEQNH